MSPIAATSASFAADVLGSDVPVLVDFWAPWCGPCRSLDPVLDQIAQEHDGRMKVVKVNTDENLELAHQFGVTSVPTMHRLVGGEQRRRRQVVGDAGRHARQAVAQVQPGVQKLLVDASQRLARILIRDRNQVHVIAVETVEYVQAQDDYISIRSAGRDFLKTQSLAELATQLDPAPVFPVPPN